MLGRAILCAAVTWIAACGSDSPTGPGPSNSPVGNYAISTVNGKGLPFTLATDGNFLLQVTTGTIGLTTDGKYSLMTTYKQTIPGNVEQFVDSSGGTWVLNGTTINLTDGADGSTGQITWTGATSQLSFAIAYNNATNTFVYTKK
jgi:hypothetical protein